MIPFHPAPSRPRARSDGSDGKEDMETIKFKGHESLEVGDAMQQGTEGGLTTFTSTVAGTGKDNPNSVANLTTDELSKSVSAKWLVRTTPIVRDFKRGLFPCSLLSLQSPFRLPFRSAILHAFSAPSEYCLRGGHGAAQPADDQGSQLLVFP